MNLEARIQNNPDVAVFARNHSKYLEAAARRNAVEPERFTTFRASTSWKTAHLANRLHGPLKIYFAAVGGEKLVEYDGVLHRIKMHPKKGDSDTETLLGFELEETKGEGLWERYGKRLDTLYVITHCQKLTNSFPMTRLLKVSDDQPISEGYGYSYCVVHRYSPEAGGDVEIFPEEIREPRAYFEGASKQIFVNAYERNKGARRECLKHHGVDCSVCGFNFERVYGEMGAGFIHVHHLKPLVEVNKKYKVDPRRDLLPICPNCHAMIHKRDPAHSIKQLRKILRINMAGN